ncbi:MAG: hypothetical protein JJU29_12585 [Verrucomicrobia bacterium]|nr:hypothetical protein [Verrucomicrobiota bacterium]MCH8510843.1 hypothetical protein [Kiritimatiellia bacterium]
MQKAGELSERLRLTLYPVPRWVDIVRRELELTEPKARALLHRLEDAGKVCIFTDTDGIERVAHAGNVTQPTGERKP